MRRGRGPVWHSPKGSAKADAEIDGGGRDVKRVAEENKTKGGIIIPDTAKEKPLEGKVIAVGNGKVLEDGKVRAMDIKAGDTILFSKYAGTEIKIDGEEHLILREEDVLGVIEK